MEITINTHSSIKIKTDKIIYIDPFKIEGNINDADYILITHSHYDHYDIDSINKIKKDNTKLIVPNSMIQKVFGKYDMNNVIGVDPSETYQIDDLSFDTIRAYNVDKQFHPKSNNWVGYLLNIEKLKALSIKDFLSSSVKNLSIGPLKLRSSLTVTYPIPGIPILEA